MGIFDRFFKKNLESPPKAETPAEEAVRLNAELAELKHRRDILIQHAMADRHPDDAGLIEDLGKQIEIKKARLKQLKELVA